MDLPLGKRSPGEKGFLLGPGLNQQIGGLDNVKKNRFMVIKELKRIGPLTVT